MAQLVKPVTWLFGVVLTIVGVVGFFMNPVLGIFQVDTIHNIIHLLSGIVAIVAVSTSEMYARWYLIVFGLVYGLVTVVGFIQQTTVLGLISINAADNYLHLAISVVCLAVGLLGAKKMQTTTVNA